MRKFEYLKKSCGLYGNAQNLITETTLNELGADGWELCTEHATETVHTYIFKREVNNETNSD